MARWLPGGNTAGEAAGADRRVRRAVGRVEPAFTTQPLVGRALERAAKAYRDAVRAALPAEPATARALLRSFDDRLPDDRYPFAQRDAGWLAGQLRDEPDVLAVIYDIAGRAGLADQRRQARDRLAEVAGRAGDADALVAWFLRWQQADLLDAATLRTALRAHLGGTTLDRDRQLWLAFFDQLPTALVPDEFEVAALLGHGADAVRLADTPARERAALDACTASPRLDDVTAGTELARRTGSDALPALRARAGDLLYEAGDHAGALVAYQDANRPDKVSRCHERLGDLPAALAACPAGDPDRLAALAQRCRPAVDALVDADDHTAAAKLINDILGHLDRSRPTNQTERDRAEHDQAGGRHGVGEGDRPGLPAVVRKVRDEVIGWRAAVVVAGHRWFERRVDAEGRAAVAGAWSRFAEAVGEPARAGQLAEESGDAYRAYHLYRRAERFGDAERVLREDGSPEGLAARAVAREAGGDLVGAAHLYEQGDRPEDAVTRLISAGEWDAAAEVLFRWRGEAAIDDPRLPDCLRRAGDLDRLVTEYLRVLGRPPEQVDGARRAGLVADLRRLRRDGLVPERLAAEVAAELGRVEEPARRAFEAHCQGWVARARDEVDRRYAGIWGFDLGTTTCAAAVYDKDERRAVLCPWKGRDQFAATLSLDSDGNELVGLAGEEVFASWLGAHISGTKRRMGASTVYRSKGREYRPEEVAARFIRHGRGMVEGFLAERVLERVGELARDELGEVRDDWLEQVRAGYELRLERPRVLLTIPAYFLNNQKHATRDACAIAGVELVRLIHEPTAACITAARERRFSGRTVVVDLGAGTLDVSFLEVEDGVYDVRQVLGNNRYGGNDLDAVISAALVVKLASQGIRLPAEGLARQRLRVAAEYLKVGLSGQERAEYTLVGLVDGQDVRLELNRDELAGILAEPLEELRRTCVAFRDELLEPPEHLVLVGGPMLAPLVRQVVEGVFGLPRTVLGDPRTAVACGAALQAAVLDRSLDELLLLDVTPLPLGIRVAGETDGDEFSALIERNTHIPAEQRRLYTTVTDDQSAVDIEIFNGDLSEGSQIGHFRLDIPAAPRGEPEIEVTFSIDESCVLEVSARDTRTGRSRSVRVTDTTLLSPTEITALTRRHEQQVAREELRARLHGLVAGADRLLGTDAEVVRHEFHDRLAAHRPPATPPDEPTQRALTAMFNESTRVEQELDVLPGPLRDLAATTRAHLGETAHPQAGPPVTDPTDPAEDPPDLVTGRHLADRLDSHLSRLRAALTRLEDWNAILIRLAVSQPDPLRRFRVRHAAGRYAPALDALADLTDPPHQTDAPARTRELVAALADPKDLNRALHCLAEIGDANGYRDLLLASAGRLGVLVRGSGGDRVDRAAWAGQVSAAMVTVSVSGEPPVRGFLISDRLVVTNRPGPVGGDLGPAKIMITMAGGVPAAVARLWVPEGGVNLALLELVEPVDVTPLRLGHPRLVRVGDPASVVVPGGGSEAEALAGTMERFEVFPERDLRLFKTDIALDAAHSGGPLLNELGEVVGVLTIPPGRAGAGFAVTADAVHPLLARTGLDPLATKP